MRKNESRAELLGPEQERREAPFPPMMAALLSGVVLGPVAALIVLLGGAALVTAGIIGVFVLVTPIAVLASSMAAVALRSAANNFNWALERKLKRDLPFDKDNLIGEPPAQRILVARGVRTERRITMGRPGDKGYTIHDFNAMLDRAYNVGFATRDFIGVELPSGWRISNDDELDEFYDLLERADFLKGRKLRHKGQLLGTLAEARASFEL